MLFRSGTLSWPQSVARALVLNQLEKLPQGGLRIDEPDGNTVMLGSAVRGNNAQANDLGHIVLADWRTYSMMMSGGALGAAEAFMEQGWSSPDLIKVIRYFAANVDAMQALEGGFAALSKPALKMLHRYNRNSLQGSRRNISAHYDLGNDFFSLFLDRTMMYSSAVFPRPDASLEEASVHKLELICQRLQLQPGMTLLEIGTGWGGLALHAAQHYGVTVKIGRASCRERV